ncbi:hypothetical protein FB567DRAFT_580003 [Paraphoma chrysanthemicola]|uniref:Protein kinase domain-containing protein n=1 Tax=Paraphoma chrysanthemicola TaxID=798071 RepID=A0A8K0VYV2_9PLEO|nr:hypothetical protein FB567DRAFT_580003 [Paraphoma chrysanthemicola]
MSAEYSTSVGLLDRSEIGGGDLLSDESEQTSRSTSTCAYSTTPSQPYLAARKDYPIDGSASFCRLAAAIGVRFQPRTGERPWARGAGEGGTAVIECHRFVPGRQFENFNRQQNTNKASEKHLVAHKYDPSRTSQYYAVKRLNNFQPGSNLAADALATQYDQLATELRVLAYKPLREHPNIIDILGVTHFLVNPILILEYGNCGSLDRFMKLEDILQRKLFELKMKLCIDIACGLEALHRHGIVHADVKASNVLVSCHNLEYHRRNKYGTSETSCNNFSAKLCDFGFSMILADDPSKMLVPKGKSRYWSAPEVTSQIGIEREMLKQIDVWSAGMVFASVFLDGDHPYAAFVQSENAYGRDIDDATLQSRLNDSTYTPFSVAMQALKFVDMAIETQDGPEALTRIAFPQQYCDWELKVIEPILKYTLSKDPTMRLLTAERVHRALKGIWGKAKLEYRKHRADCQGGVAAFERGIQSRGPEVTFEGFTPQPEPKSGCSSCQSSKCQPLQTCRSADTVDLRRTYTLFTGTMTDHLAQSVMLDLLSRVEDACGIQRNSRPIGATFQDIADEIESRLQVLAARATYIRSNHEPANRNLRPEVADCAYQLSIACLDGQGTKQNPQLAMNILDIAATLGSHRAYHDRSLLAAATGNPKPTATQLEQDLHLLSSPETRPWDQQSQLSPLDYYATLLSPMLVQDELMKMRHDGLDQQSIHYEMARTLVQLTRRNKCQLMLTGRENWESQFRQVLQILATPEAMLQIPNLPKLAATKGNIDFLTFVGEYNTIAFRWLVDKYSVAELQRMFPRTFKVTLGWLLNPNIHCGYMDRVEIAMEFAAGNPLLTTTHLLHAAVHHQPSLFPQYGELFKKAGAREALFESNHFGETPFDVALQYGFTDVMKYLLENGASYDEYRIKPDVRVDQSECSPLATVLGYKTQVDFLMQLDPKPRLVVTRSGMNVFHVLASKEATLGSALGVDLVGQLNTFFSLSPELIDRQGGREQQTPFHFVALHYATTVGEFLHRHGADINKRDRRGRTPLDLLLQHGSPTEVYNSHSEDEDSQSKFICDYVTAGPSYWKRERELKWEMQRTFRRWGARRSREFMVEWQQV